MFRGLALAAIGLALAASPVMAKKVLPRMRGVVEGYYGHPWSGEARRDVIRFMGAHDLNTFVYGPKNDPYHRDRWREPYPASDLADLRATVRVAEKAKVRFVYALSPGIDICFTCKDDFTALTKKLRQLARARVRHFALFFDDLFGRTIHPGDVEEYGGSDGPALARAHANLTNRVDRWLRAHHLPGLAFMIPSDYEGTECHPYHTELAARLRRRMPVGWTGPGVFSTALSGAEARARAACVGDHPVVLWDNYPVNDAVLSSNLHMGPLTGRDAELTRVVHGHLLNPMTQAHASLVALGTAGAYFRDPSGYDPEAAWETTLAELDPGGGLATFAAQTRSSPLDLDDAAALGAALGGASSTYTSADWAAAMDALASEIATQAAAPAAMDASLGGSPLASEIAPWVAELAAHTSSATAAIDLLRSMKPAFQTLATKLAGGMLHVTGVAVGPDDAKVAALGPTFATPPPVRGFADFGDLVRCMGGPGALISADINFCPQYGLNVHGKSLYVYPRTSRDLEVVTGRNVHEHLLAFVAERYADYLARQSPGSTTLTLTLEGTPVTLGTNGAFDVSIPTPPSGRARLVVSTAAGDTTAADVP
ncbi:MAG TPA: protein O-GlcNAcase [Candidatus Eisenbacteria bacterium]|nr:protein O-GlcNAcase [Candidatus Eisenbacteria bacterium]